MKITVDTNVLLRAFIEDDPAQSQTAIETLEGAEIVAVSLQSLCEFAWVLKRQYEASRTDIASGIRALLDTQNVVVNRPAAEAGLTVLEAEQPVSYLCIQLDLFLCLHTNLLCLAVD